MKKQLLAGLVFVASVFCAVAGDAAAFVDIGISADGKTYAFGEYGRTDVDFQGYAEIYTVDIAKNDFVSGEVFKTKPAAATGSKSGKEVYDELYKKAEWKLRKYAFKPASAESLLYVKDANKSADSEIVFKDFEGSTPVSPVFYHITLEKNVEGSGINCKSSFFITMIKTDENGKVISRNIVGSPDIKRKSVTGYQINKIFSDESGRNLVFIVEKTMADKSGTSIRYMVETIHL